jgi:hypothetical protein
METVVYVVSVISGIYGLGWLIFTFVEPPGALHYWFRAPSALYFLPERVARFLIGVVCAFVIPTFASMIVASLFK